MGTGLGIGGAWGLAEGLRHKEATSYRLQLTTVLNAVTKRGPSLGNRIGVLGMVALLVSHKLSATMA